MTFKTIKVRRQGSICFLQFYRPEQKNAINRLLVEECLQVLDEVSDEVAIVVIEGLPDVFCSGADFSEISAQAAGEPLSDPDSLYELWYRLATGPFCSVAHVKGKVNAGGVGFVAACDIVLADSAAEISLSELLFGLYPACVLPFLIRRIGSHRANYLTLMTKPISVAQAKEWGLVDDMSTNSDDLLRLHLLRLRRLTKRAVANYKRYMSELLPFLRESKQKAVAANRSIFSDAENLANIQRFVASGRFPWEQS